MGRPRKAPGTSEHEIVNRALAIESFYHFCIQQQLRLMKDILGYSEETHWNLDEAEITRLYREERLGTYFNGWDRQDQRIQMETRQ